MADRTHERGARWRKPDGLLVDATNATGADVAINPKQGKLLDLQRQAGNAAVEWGVQRWGGGGKDEDEDARLDQPGEAKGGAKAPPRSGVTWGGGGPQFGGVTESIGVKYTMFLPDGVPSRPTVGLKMKQAAGPLGKSKSESYSKSEGKNSTSGGTTMGSGKDEQVEDPKEKWRR